MILSHRSCDNPPRFLYMESARSDLKLLSRVGLFATPWTVAYQAPPSMGFSRQEYWSGVPLPSLGKCTVSAKLVRKCRASFLSL